MFLLGTCLILLLTLQGCSSEIGGRHIRRITAADLPSSENADDKKIRAKNIQSGSETNCSLTEPCNNTNTDPPPVSQASVDTASSKIVSSYVADDVLQGRLHVTTTSAPYDFTTAISTDDTTARYIQKETSSNRYPNIQNSRLRSTLTTPKISTFDDFYAKLAEGIHQNLDADEYPYRNVAQTHGINLPRYASGHSSTRKGNFSIGDFKSNYSIVYNDSFSPQSIRRDVLTENGTSFTFEEFKIHTEVEPEINHTTVHHFNDSNLPSVSVSNDNLKNKSGNNVENVAASTITVDNVNSTNQYSEKLINNTGTPGDKDSTTSEQTWGKPYIVSQELTSNTQKGNISSVTNRPSTYTIPSPSSKVENDSSSIIQHLVNSTLVNKSSKSQKASIDPIKKSTSSGNNFRNGRTFVFRRNENSENATSNINGTLETSATRPPENGLTNVQPTKKPKTGSIYWQTEFNTTDVKTDGSSITPKPSESSDSTTTIGDSEPSVSTVPVQEEVSTPEYSTSSRSRAFTFRRPYTTPSSHLNDGTRKTTDRSSIGSTTQSNNADRVRQRLTTLRRRYQSSTEPNYTIVSSSNSTPQSSGVRGTSPVRTRRPTLTKSSLNETSDSRDSTQNNEGNDITTPKINVLKPITRNRGSVRYGSLRNNSLVLNPNYGGSNESVSFPLPPTAAAWSLVTLRGPENESKVLNYSGPDNNTTIENCTERISYGRGRRPCSTMETGKFIILFFHNIISQIKSL
ncbi:hypothetical protein C0J52_05323 [Blattella germanica]|nr:hypothetical protein C0J52_05323 [Blattella germanica]